MLRNLFGARTTKPQIFSVVDLETTGLFPKKHDRILEIAVIQIDSRGTILNEFATLVNPGRDVGATEIHGIETRHILDAPKFAEIAGDVTGALAGSVLVAHNARFDWGFLVSEYARLGYRLPDAPTVCTLRLVTNRLPDAPSRRLSVVCEYLGVPHGDSHTALGDARATAAVFATLFSQFTHTPSLSDLGCRPAVPPSNEDWPSIDPTGRRHTRSDAVRHAKPAYIPRLVERLPAVTTSSADGAAEYSDMLDRVLEDRRVTAEETEALLEIASSWGLGQAEAQQIHRQYMRSLAAAALSDGVVTEAERRDLREVAVLLGCSEDDLERLLETSRLTSPDSPRQRHDLAGQTICFTGESRCYLHGATIDRRTAHELAHSAGLVVKDSVTKGLDLLIVADPDSLSGKAQKARRYGTRIMAEAVFWQTIGVHVD